MRGNLPATAILRTDALSRHEESGEDAANVTASAHYVITSPLPLRIGEARRRLKNYQKITIKKRNESFEIRWYQCWFR